MNYDTPYQAIPEHNIVVPLTEHQLKNEWRGHLLCCEGKDTVQSVIESISNAQSNHLEVILKEGGTSSF